MDKYIEALENIFNSFTEVRKVFDEAFQGQKLLKGLGKEYMPLKRTLANIDDSELTIDTFAKSLKHVAKYNSSGDDGGIFMVGKNSPKFMC
jgi:hypothetical protein